MAGFLKAKNRELLVMAASAREAMALVASERFFAR
jgi:hypothetical protein